MTAAPHSPLVERVARSCARWRNGKKLAFPDFEALSETEKAAYRDQAQAALDACNAEEMRNALKFIVDQVSHPANGTHTLEAFKHGAGIATAEAILAKLDGQP